jgi:L-lactate dehydrogenase complex protein LldE
VRVAVFVTCMNNMLYPRTGVAVVTVLERLGVSVDYVENQTCCGQMHLNAGYRREGLVLARRTLDAFEHADAVVVPSGSCTSTMRHLWGDVARDEDDTAVSSRLRDFAPRVYEFSEFLVDRLGVVNVGARFPHTVAYHPTCHSLRHLRVGDRPTQLLRAVEGLTLLEIERPDSCCGFGGVFAVKNSEVSAAMGLDKIEEFRRSSAEYLCASDNSCLTHLRTLSERHGPTVPTVHLAEILAMQEIR